MKKCCIVLLTICCILLTTACNDKSTVNTDTKNTSSVSSEVEGNESINSQKPSNTEEESRETSSEDNSKETTIGSKPTHQHSYISTVTKEATCASSGTKKYHCSCGHSYTETIAKTSHNYSSATCTSAKKCTLCGSTSGDALGHNYSNGYCTRCNSADPTPKKTLNIPSLPLTAKYLYLEKTVSIIKITDISYEFESDGDLAVYISGEKTYGWDEKENGGATIRTTLKVYDSKGYVVGDSFLWESEISVGEKFRKKVNFNDIPKDCTSFTLEITDYIW